MPGFTTYDASAGVSKGSWAVQIFGQNLTNVNSSVSTSATQFILTEVPLRPRVLGVKVSYKFPEK
jgi:iron complex outermembrane receptor protein